MSLAPWVALASHPKPTMVRLSLAAVLERPDVADHAPDVLRANSIEEVVVLGQRGAAPGGFTSAALREARQETVCVVAATCAKRTCFACLWPMRRRRGPRRRRSGGSGGWRDRRSTG